MKEESALPGSSGLAKEKLAGSGKSVCPPAWLEAGHKGGC